jgi:hypothetical protein
MNAPIMLRGVEYLLNTETDRRSLWFEGVLYNADELREMLQLAAQERSGHPRRKRPEEGG